MNATVAINAKYVCLYGFEWSSVISCYFSNDQNMTGLTVCPGENKPTILFVSIKWPQHEIAIQKKNRRKKSTKIYDVFFRPLFLFVSHSDTKSGAKQLN